MRWNWYQTGCWDLGRNHWPAGIQRGMTPSLNIERSCSQFGRPRDAPDSKLCGSRCLASCKIQRNKIILINRHDKWFNEIIILTVWCFRNWRCPTAVRLSFRWNIETTFGTSFEVPCDSWWTCPSSISWAGCHIRTCDTTIELHVGTYRSKTQRAHKSGMAEERLFCWVKHMTSFSISRVNE